MARICYAVVFVALALAGCVAKPRQTWGACEFAGFQLRTDFPAARAGACRAVGREFIEVRIEPENQPINPSPWFAFKLLADSPRQLKLRMVYAHGHRHRYVPKVSEDGESWSPLDAARISVSADGTFADLHLRIGPEPLWVAAQELWTVEHNDAWLRSLSARYPALEIRKLGDSLEGRPLWMIDSAPTGSRAGAVVILGRQHPPEVSGAFALMSFVEELLGTDDDMREFRQQFRLLVVPMLNPDGVTHGHWRHNRGGADLNRDWRQFAQPETRLMRGLLRDMADNDAAPLTLVLDFHSTRRDVMYTQRDDEQTRPVDFTRRWIENLRNRAPGYELERDSRNTGLASARNFVYQTYGVPSITYEVGDHTDRDRIDEVSRAGARALVDTLMVQP